MDIHYIRTLHNALCVNAYLNAYIHACIHTYIHHTYIHTNVQTHKHIGHRNYVYFFLSTDSAVYVRLILITFILHICLLTKDVTYDKETNMKVRLYCFASLEREFLDKVSNLFVL